MHVNTSTTYKNNNVCYKDKEINTQDINHSLSTFGKRIVTSYFKHTLCQSYWYLYKTITYPVSPGSLSHAIILTKVSHKGRNIILSLDINTFLFEGFQVHKILLTFYIDSFLKKMAALTWNAKKDMGSLPRLLFKKYYKSILIKMARRL